MFKTLVLQDWESRLTKAPTEEDKVVIQAEIERLRTVLDLFIPVNGDSHAQ